jgi:hypothetical protein
MTFLEGFVIISIGLWRVVSLLANEGGPFDLFSRIRGWIKIVEGRSKILRGFKLYDGFTCEWCLGFWLALPSLLAWVYLREDFVYLMAIPAMSTFVIIIKYIIQTLQQVQEYMVKLNKE